MSDCLFCKIVNGEIPSDKLYESDKVIAFNDINPQAPVHVLVVSREHIQDTNGLGDNHSQLLGECFQAIKKITRELGIDQEGYRVITNTGNHGGQEVPHLHFHILGGEPVGKLRCS